MARAKLKTTKVRIIDDLTQENLREKNNAMHSKRGDLNDQHSHGLDEITGTNRT